MAMTPAGLSAALHSALEVEFDIFDDDVLQRFCDACGDAIVNYVQENADVVAQSHSGESLSSATGQPVHVNLGTGDGTTVADEQVVGKGSIL